MRWKLKVGMNKLQVESYKLQVARYKVKVRGICSLHMDVLLRHSGMLLAGIQGVRQLFELLADNGLTNTNPNGTKWGELFHLELKQSELN
jgi:hypothetical protein